MTAPPGGDWEAVFELVAKKADGTRVRWTEELPLISETAVYTVTPPVQDDAVATLLVARVTFVSEEGQRLRAGLKGQFVVATGGVYVATEQRFTGATWEGPSSDPHDGLDLDLEGKP